MGSLKDVRDQMRRFADFGIELLFLEIIPTSANVVSSILFVDVKAKAERNSWGQRHYFGVWRRAASFSASPKLPDPIR
jgi:hypothetical protein